jgi:tetratricopeptide (TPR) repeat protein
MAPRVPIHIVARLRIPLLSLVVSTAGCGAQASPSPAPVAMPAPASTAARTLALTTVEGDAASARAVRAVQARLAALPDKSDLWIELGRAWIRQARTSADPGYYLHADAAAEVALEASPGHPEAINLRALVALHRHDFAGARDLARTILRRDPDNAMALGSLSDALLELGDISGAEAAAQAMMDRKPNLPSYTRASWLRWLKGDVEGARHAIRVAYDAGRGQPDREPAAWTLVQAAQIFWHEGDYDGAEAGFDLALTELPDHPQALVGKARVAMARADYSAAVTLLERSDAASPLAETAWLLGDARTASGDVTGAAQAYAEVRRRGAQGDARTLALFLATRDESPAEARRLAEAERRHRGGPYTDDARAFALLRAGEPAQAQAVMQSVLALGTRDASLWYHAGAIALANGDAATGKEWLRKALALNPAFDYTGALEARALLAGTP